MKYRKRPLVIHALQWTGDNAAEIKAFVGRRPGTGEPAFLVPEEAPDRGWDEAHLWTEAEGSWDRCPVGHWVVRGVMGEFYPHHPDSFARTYEPVEAEQGTPSRSR